MIRHTSGFNFDMSALRREIEMVLWSDDKHSPDYIADLRESVDLTFINDASISKDDTSEELDAITENDEKLELSDDEQINAIADL